MASILNPWIEAFVEQKIQAGLHWLGRPSDDSSISALDTSRDTEERISRDDSSLIIAPPSCVSFVVQILRSRKEDSYLQARVSDGTTSIEVELSERACKLFEQKQYRSLADESPGVIGQVSHIQLHVALDGRSEWNVILGVDRFDLVQRRSLPSQTLQAVHERQSVQSGLIILRKAMVGQRGSRSSKHMDFGTAYGSTTAKRPSRAIASSCTSDFASQMPSYHTEAAVVERKGYAPTPVHLAPKRSADHTNRPESELRMTEETSKKLFNILSNKTSKAEKVTHASPLPRDADCQSQNVSWSGQGVGSTTELRDREAGRIDHTVGQNHETVHVDSFECVAKVNYCAEIDEAQRQRLQDSNTWFHPEGARPFPASNVPISYLEHFQDIAKRRSRLGLLPTPPMLAEPHHSPVKCDHQRRQASLTGQTPLSTSPSSSVSIDSEDSAQSNRESPAHRVSDAAEPDHETGDSRSSPPVSWSSSPPEHLRRNSVPPDSSSLPSEASASGELPRDGNSSDIETGIPYAEGERIRRSARTASKLEERPRKRHKVDVYHDAETHIHETPRSESRDAIAVGNAEPARHSHVAQTSSSSDARQTTSTQAVKSSSSASRVPATVLKQHRSRHDFGKSSSPHDNRSQYTSDAAADRQILHEMSLASSNQQGRRPSSQVEVIDLCSPDPSASKSVTIDSPSASAKTERGLSESNVRPPSASRTSRHLPEATRMFQMTQSEELRVHPIERGRLARSDFMKNRHSKSAEGNGCNEVVEKQRAGGETRTDARDRPSELSPAIALQDYEARRFAEEERNRPVSASNALSHRRVSFPAAPHGPSQQPPTSTTELRPPLQKGLAVTEGPSPPSTKQTQQHKVSPIQTHEVSSAQVPLSSANASSPRKQSSRPTPSNTQQHLHVIASSDSNPTSPSQPSEAKKVNPPASPNSQTNVLPPPNASSHPKGTKTPQHPSSTRPPTSSRSPIPSTNEPKRHPSKPKTSPHPPDPAQRPLGIGIGLESGFSKRDPTTRLRSEDELMPFRAFAKAYAELRCVDGAMRGTEGVGGLARSGRASALDPAGSHGGLHRRPRPFVDVLQWKF
ncbi:MAG: hypothetical protein M1828_000283 [Chrysothrix sp. TS-e1954]|nr:MAG: hypothetical protein M1828_000283 [Chrysothrix sp. TS-e1954]